MNPNNQSRKRRFYSRVFILLISSLALAACGGGSGGGTTDEDSTAPVITLQGDNPLIVEYGSSYSDPGASASDDVDGDLSASIVIGGDSVDTASIGSYTVTYDVSDAAGNAATQVTRTVQVVDTTTPVITLQGDNPLIVEYGSSYSDPGASASDAVDGDLSSAIVVNGSVNTTAIGSYTVTYDVTDTAGNAATQVMRTVHVVDTTAPVITLLGDNPLNLVLGSAFSEPGAIAADNVDGDISASIVIGGDSVDTNIEGSYVITYNVSDAAGNAASQVTRTVNVGDRVAPVITLLGPETLYLALNSSFTDPGVTATDNVDGDISANVVVGGDSVDTATEGSYTVTYNVSDAAGNAAQQVTRRVIVDGTAPVISLLGDNPVNLKVGDQYTEPGATATDDINGDISSDIVIGGDSVDTGSVGVYVITYDVSDAAGNAAIQATRTVNVENDPPVINSLSISSDPAYTQASTTFSWNVSDANGDSLTCQLDIDNDGTNDYTINDCANNTSQVHVFGEIGTYRARLSVSDGIAAPVSQTIDFRVLASLSTAVSVDSPAEAGKRVLLTVTLANATRLPIDGVSVLLRVPTGLSFYYTTDAEPDASGCGICSQGQEAVWAIGTLEAGESRSISINATVDAATLAGTEISAPFTVSANGLNDITINKTFVVSTPSSELVAGASTDPVTPSQSFDYRLDFANTSAGTLTGVTLRAYLPDGVTIDAISDGGSEVSPGVVEWSESDLAVGISRQRTIRVSADAGLTPGEVLKLDAELIHDGGLAVDRRAEFATNVVASALPLQVDISSAVNPVVSDERVLLTFTVDNSSLLPVNDVKVLLRLPPELSFYYTTDAEPSASSCGACADGNEAVWNLGTLAAGESRSIQVNALVATVLSGNLIDLRLRVTATDLGDDIQLQKTLAIYNSPSSELVAGASTDPVTPSQSFDYRLDFANTSAGTLTGVTLRAYLPDGVTIDAISDGGSEVSPGVVEWSIGSLNSGNIQARTISISADSANAGDILKLHAELFHDGALEVDQRSEVAISVTEANSIADKLAVSMSAAPDPVASSSTLLYTINISNTYGLPVDNVRVMLRVPPEISFYYTTDANPDASNCGNCSDGDEAVWMLGTMASGASQVITINATTGAAVSNGELIVAPLWVTADGMIDTVTIDTVTGVSN